MPNANDILTVLAALIGTPMRGQQMLPGLYDPTGQGFQHDGQTSTELNIITGEPGNYHMVPTLVPGQRDEQNLLADRKPSSEQMRIADKYASSRDSEVPKFKTVGEALDYEKRRHQGLDQGYRPLRDEDLLSWLMLVLGANNP